MTGLTGFSGYLLFCFLMKQSKPNSLLASSKHITNFILMYYYNLLHIAVNTIRFLIPPWADCLLPFSSEKWEKEVNPINPVNLV